MGQIDDSVARSPSRRNFTYSLLCAIRMLIITKFLDVNYLTGDFFGDVMFPVVNKLAHQTFSNDKIKFSVLSQKIVDLSLAFLWPVNKSFELFDFLFEKRQYEHIIVRLIKYLFEFMNYSFLKISSLNMCLMFCHQDFLKIH